MEEKIYKCPENLLDILSCLPPAVYDSIFRKPDIEDVTAENQDMGVVVSGQTLGKQHARVLRAYERNKDMRDFLAVYGDSREAIIENLASHVKQCPACSQVYAKYIDESAEQELRVGERLARNPNESAQEVGKRIINDGYLKTVWACDSAHLGILKTI